MSNRLFRSDCFFSANVSADLYAVLKRSGAILWPETAFIGPLSDGNKSGLTPYIYIKACIWRLFWANIRVTPLADTDSFLAFTMSFSHIFSQPVYENVHPFPATTSMSADINVAELNNYAVGRITMHAL